MAKQVINTGSTPNARDGDTLYSAFNKVNSNFTEVYTQLTPYTAGTGISVTDKVISVAAGYTGQTSITTVSDTTGVTTGVWKATAISPQSLGHELRLRLSEPLLTLTLTKQIIQTRAHKPIQT